MTPVQSGATANVTPSDLEASTLEFLRQATRGEFEIHRELGRGGMATVYLARDLALNREVAIKVMAPALGADEAMAERFVREAQTAASLSHPNIIPVYTVKHTANVTFFVMKFVKGRPLDDIMKEIGALPIPLVTAILSQVAGALGYGHKRGIVHRDVKPGNVMIDDEGWAVVTDFGIAKVDHAEGLTQTGAAIGTPTYMSPEQCTAKPVTGASDQYSLGVMAYEMLSGRKPFDGDSVMAIMYGHVNEPAPPFLDIRPDCPPSLHDTVMRMLAKQAEDRFGSLAEVVNALGEVATGPTDPVRTEMMTLAASGLSSKFVQNVQRPRTPVPLESIQKSAVRPSAPTLRTPRASEPVDSGDAVRKSSAQSIRRKSRAGVLAGLVVAAVATVGGVTMFRGRAPAVPPEAAPNADTASAARSAEQPVVSLPARVMLTPPDSSLVAGEEMTLEPLVLDAGGDTLADVALIWHSSAPRVASVSDGLVLAHATGSAEIMVSAGDQQASFPLRVTAPPVSRPAPVRVARIQVSPRSQRMAVGETVQLSATPLDAAGGTLRGRSVSWSSSNTGVVRVDRSGRVRGVGAGTATITARRDEGVAEVEVTVTPVAVATVSLTPSTLTLDVGESRSVQVVVRDAGGDPLSLTGRRVQWTSADPAVATVSTDGQVRAAGGGNTTVSATVDGRSGSLEVSVAAPVARPAGPTEVESRAAVTGLIEAYRTAFESRDLAAVRRAYPAMTAQQEESWGGFFESVRDLAVTFDSPVVTLDGMTASATVHAQWQFRTNQTVTREFDQVFSFEYRDGAWVMTGWRSPS